jgi:hypothetical protein
MQWHIFLSYARKDDRPVGYETIGWITRFSADLETSVTQVRGKTIQVWYDKRLDGNEYFADSIDVGLANSSLLVPVVSPSYIEDESGWLRREREAFIAATALNGGLRLGNKSRICPVFKTQVDKTRLPEELSALNCKYRFYDNATGHPLRGDRYNDLLFDFAHTTVRMLQSLEKRGAEN